MTSRDWIQLAATLAWPTVGLLALVYVWRSDAIGKLLKISDAVKDLRERMRELVEVEERLSQSASAISGVTATVNQLQADFLSMKADVENIRDNVDQRPEVQVAGSRPEQEAGDLKELFSEIDDAWQELTTAMQSKFGWFDGRKTGSEAYRFTHENRKGPRLTEEQADEVARLHSTIKSYRRRQASLADWLTSVIRDDFVNACSAMVAQIERA